MTLPSPWPDVAGMASRIGGRPPLLKGLLLVAFGFSIALNSITFAIEDFVLPHVSAGGFESVRFFDLLIGPLSFLVSPVLLLIVFYRLGGRLDLKSHYWSVAFSLFLGGFTAGVCSLLVVFLGILLVSGVPFSDFPSAYFGSSNLGLVAEGVVTMMLGLVSEGLGVMFSGFFAVAMANFRLTSQPAQASVEPVDQ